MKKVRFSRQQELLWFNHTSDKCQSTKAEQLQWMKSWPDFIKLRITPWWDRESRQPHSAILRLTCVRIYLMRERNKNKSTITNIWKSELLRWPCVPIQFQIYGNITALAPAVFLSDGRPIYLLAFKTGCYTHAMLSARPTASHTVFASLSILLFVCLNIKIYYVCASVCISPAMPSFWNVPREFHLVWSIRAAFWGEFFFFPLHMTIKEMGPTTRFPSHWHIYSSHTSTGRHDWIFFSWSTNVFLCSQTQSVNVRGPSSLSLGLVRCQTTFLQQLPFLTSAALTWFHLTVVRNLFSFSVMKYYTETPGPAVLYVLFVIPWLSLCYEWLWLLFYSAVYALGCCWCYSSPCWWEHSVPSKDLNQLHSLCERKWTCNISCGYV